MRGINLEGQEEKPTPKVKTEEDSYSSLAEYVIMLTIIVILVIGALKILFST